MQLKEHEPVQVTWHVEPPPQEMLPLGPTVVVQIELPVHSMLHEEPQLPAHVV